MQLKGDQPYTAMSYQGSTSAEGNSSAVSRTNISGCGLRPTIGQTQ